MKDKKKYSNIIVTGSVAYDEILDFPKEFKDFFQPDKLHNINVSFVVDRLEKQLGGTGTNIAYSLSLLSDLPIKLLAGLGKDNRDFMDFFKENNILTEGILIDKSLYTATGKVITDIKDNQIWGFYYGACEKGKDINFNTLVDVDSFMIISANHKDAFMNAQSHAIKNNIDYMYDIGMAVTWIDLEDLKEGISHCKYLVGNDYEISSILEKTGSDINELIGKGTAIITTLGEKGVQYIDSKNEYEVSAYKSVTIVDPTGAGDAFRGGFVEGITSGKSILDSLKQGNAIASFAIEKYGTVNHKPSRSDIASRVNQLNG